MPASLPGSPGAAQGSFTMRAELESVVQEIQQSMALLRRHL
jgi:hypothetical protein